MLASTLQKQTVFIQTHICSYNESKTTVKGTIAKQLFFSNILDFLLQKNRFALETFRQIVPKTPEGFPQTLDTSRITASALIKKKKCLVVLCHSPACIAPKIWFAPATDLPAHRQRPPAYRPTGNGHRPTGPATATGPPAPATGPHKKNIYFKNVCV